MMVDDMIIFKDKMYIWESVTWPDGSHPYSNNITPYLTIQDW